MNYANSSTFTKVFTPELRTIVNSTFKKLIFQLSVKPGDVELSTNENKSYCSEASGTLTMPSHYLQ